MKVNEELISFDDAKIVFRNFAGVQTEYNSEGSRNFCVVIDDEEKASQLLDEGFNVKIKPPREEGDRPFIFMKVNVNFNANRPGLNPNIYLVTGEKISKLDADTVSILDHIDIASVDMDLRKYHNKRNSGTGVTAYLKAMRVVQDIDRFAAEMQAYDSKPYNNDDDIKF